MSFAPHQYERRKVYMYNVHHIYSMVQAERKLVGFYLFIYTEFHEHIYIHTSEKSKRARKNIYIELNDITIEDDDA